MTQEQKHYYAFISHSSEDEKTAKWLCKQLEGYHIPAVIQKDYHAPKRLKPIFLFQTDLSGNKLRDALEGELSDSQFLIVLCSPAAAKSDYVNKEVKHFIDSGRYDKIIPFIIDGTPFASLKGDLENECFPSAMVALKGTEQELRGIDLRQEQKDRGSKKAAVIDVIASMLGVRMDVLWNRYRKSMLINRVLACILSIIFLCVLIGTSHLIMTRKEQYLMARSEVIAKKANKLIEEQDSYLAQLLLLEVLPSSITGSKSISAEAELALLRSLQTSNTKLPYSRIGGYNLRLSPNDKYIIGHSRYDTVYVWRCINGELINKFYIPNISGIFFKRDDGYCETIITFISDSTLCVVDSMAHVYNIETGTHVEDIDLSVLGLTSCNIFGIGKRINMEVAKKNKILDVEEASGYYLKIENNDQINLCNKQGEIMDRFIMSNLLAAFFKNKDEVIVIAYNAIYVWSIPSHSFITAKNFNIEVEYDEYDHIREISNVYCNQSNNRMVVEGLIGNGEFDLHERWLLFDLNHVVDRDVRTMTPLSTPCPILVNGDGNICIYNRENIFDNDYIVSYSNQLNSHIATQLRYPHLYYPEDSLMTDVYLWDAKYFEYTNGENQYVVNCEDSVLFIDAYTMNCVLREKPYLGGWLCASNNGQYYVTNYNDSLLIYKDKKIIRVIGCDSISHIQNAEISGSGEYLLTMHYELDSINKEILVVRNLGDIAGGKIIWQDKSYIFGNWKFSLDGKKLYASNAKVISLDDFSFSTFREDYFNYDIHDSYDMYYSPAGRYVIFFNGGEVLVWDAHNKEFLWRAKAYGKREPFVSVRSDQDEKILLVNTRWRTDLYHLKTGVFIKSIDYMEGVLGDHLNAFFSPNSKKIFIITTCGVYSYDFMPLDDMIKIARSNLHGRKLSKEERSKYLTK